MDAKTFAEVHTVAPKKLSEQQLKQLVVDLEQRAVKAEKQLEDYQLIAMYASDIVNTWPTITFRTIRNMCSKMETLKQALDKIVK